MHLSSPIRSTSALNHLYYPQFFLTGSTFESCFIISFHIWSCKVPRSTPVCSLHVTFSVLSKDPRLTITQRGRNSHNCIQLILHLLLYGLYLLDCFLCGDHTQLIYVWKKKQYEDERMKKRIKMFSGLLLVSEIYTWLLTHWGRGNLNRLNARSRNF